MLPYVGVKTAVVEARFPIFRLVIGITAWIAVYMVGSYLVEKPKL
jgi:hypothetical protein